MKKLLLLLSLFVVSSLSFGQIHVDKFYENKDELLIYSVVQEFDSISIDDLNIKVKNWASTNFVNMKEVLISETKEQLVFVYITESLFRYYLGIQKFINPWYLRMVVQIKDDKIKISIYDDGNCFWVVDGTHVAARTHRVYDMVFKKDGFSRKTYDEGIINLRNCCISTSDNLIKSIKSNNNW